MKRKLHFHILCNAHLDPVWLWDKQEGLTEGITTCRTILDLMDRFPELTFNRGESLIYEHIYKYDKPTFKRILKMVAAGRWDVVGGSYLQADTNLPATETLVRQFVRGQSFFKKRMNLSPEVAWFADTFGHTSGLPEILSSRGVPYLAFTRPGQNVFPLEQPAFRWMSESGKSVLCYRPAGAWENGLWYGCERHNINETLDLYRIEAETHAFHNIGVLIGLGNHGGGPSRRHIEDIYAWADAHPDVCVEFSTMHRFFNALHKEVDSLDNAILPVHTGEINFCLRGCYASAARFKSAYRRAQSCLLDAERSSTAISAYLGKKVPDLSQAWDVVLFNAFHDILTGTSIERAFYSQTAEVGAAFYEAETVKSNAIRDLADNIDTTVYDPKVDADEPTEVPVLVFNPHPWEYRGHVEIEACLDYRLLHAYKDCVDEVPIEVRDAKRRPIGYQRIRTEHEFMVPFPWRARVIAPVKVPPMGWAMMSIGMGPKGKLAKPAKPALTTSSGTISNGDFKVAAKSGASGIKVFYRNKPLLKSSGLGCVSVLDQWGSWGGMEEEPKSFKLSKVLHKWTVTAFKVLEAGPLRSKLWVRMEGGDSWLDLEIMLSAGCRAIEVSGRLLMSERSTRIQLVLPCDSNDALYETPGGVAERGAIGEVPGQRWVSIKNNGNGLGFCCNALYSYSTHGKKIHVTLARATRYATDVNHAPDECLWKPVVEPGETKFKFILTSGNEDLVKLADMLEEPISATVVTPSPGDLSRSGSMTSIAPANLRILALYQNDEGDIVLRAQEQFGRAIRSAKLLWMGREMELGSLGKRAIQTWILKRKGSRWRLSKLSKSDFMA